jgi:hypothetical protein
MCHLLRPRAPTRCSLGSTATDSSTHRPPSRFAHGGEPVDVKGQRVAFELSKQQRAERNALAADLRKKAETLNSAIGEFNETVEPLSQAVGEAQEDYNGILQKARWTPASLKG